jgi:uncharacterized protein (TIGR03437 family)
MVVMVSSCCGVAQAQNMSGTWQINARSTVYSIQTAATGQITQTGTGVVAQLNITGSVCATVGAGNGTLTGSTLNLEMTEANQSLNCELVQFAGTVSADGNSASGTYSTPSIGCTNGDRGTWSGTRTEGLVTSVSNAASGSVANIAPGSIISVYGISLAASTGAAKQLPLPTLYENHGIVLVDSKGQGTSLPLFYWSGSQLNAQIPSVVSVGAYGLALVTCTSYQSDGSCTAAGPVTQFFNVLPQAAGIFQNPTLDCLASIQPYNSANCSKSALVVRGIVTDQSGNLINASNPAHSGELLTVWLTGLGTAAKDPTTGYTESVLRPELWLLNSPIKNGSTVIQNILSSQQGTLLFAGPSSDYGLDQINFTFDLSSLRSGKLCGTALADDLALAVRLATSPAGTGYSNMVRLPIVVQAGDFPCR